MRADNKILRAKIKLQKYRPFFSVLLSTINFLEDTSGHLIPKDGGWALDHTGTVWYNQQYILDIPEVHLIRKIMKIALHVMYEHMERGNHTNEFAWHVAIDLVVNDILIKDGFSVNDTLKPDCSDCFIGEIQGQKIKLFNISKKSAEQLYLECIVQCEDMPFNGPEMFILGKISKDQHEQLQKVITQSFIIAQDMGKNSSAQERIIELLGRKKSIDWRLALRAIVQQVIPTQYSFSRRNRKVRSAYMPTLEKGLFEIFVAIDTSGSVSDEQLSAFINEIAGIGQTYPSVSLNVIDCDSAVHSVQKVTPSGIKALSFKGNGGTSHVALFEYIENKKLNPKVLVCFTDGQSDIERCHRPKYPVVWILPKSAQKPHFGHIVIIGE